MVPKMDCACALNEAKHASETRQSRLLTNRSLKNMEANPREESYIVLI
jgi:hypothetical protein